VGLDQWLLKFDPANFSFTVFVFIILVSVILFFWLKFWPWWTQIAWPARQKMELTRMEFEAKQEASRLEVMSGIRDTLIELKVLIQQNSVTTQAISDRLTGGERKTEGQLLALLPRP
jgi:hypothetical protein